MGHAGRESHEWRRRARRQRRAGWYRREWQRQHRRSPFYRKYPGKFLFQTWTSQRQAGNFLNANPNAALSENHAELSRQSFEAPSVETDRTRLKKDRSHPTVISDPPFSEAPMHCPCLQVFRRRVSPPRFSQEQCRSWSCLILSPRLPIHRCRVL